MISLLAEEHLFPVCVLSGADEIDRSSYVVPFAVEGDSSFVIDKSSVFAVPDSKDRLEELLLRSVGVDDPEVISAPEYMDSVRYPQPFVHWKDPCFSKSAVMEEDISGTEICGAAGQWNETDGVYTPHSIA